MSSTTILICLFIGQLTVTSYQSIPSQTDGSPNYTSIGQRTRKGGIAVSQDLLCPAGKTCRRTLRGCNPKAVHYGDYLLVEGMGIFQVNDTMNPRWRNRADVWVESGFEEKAFDQKFRGKKFTTYRVVVDAH